MFEVLSFQFYVKCKYPSLKNKCFPDISCQNDKHCHETRSCEKNGVSDPVKQSKVCNFFFGEKILNHFEIKFLIVYKVNLDLDVDEALRF